MVQQPDLEHDMDAQLASQLEQMGLPAGFSTSKVYLLTSTVSTTATCCLDLLIVIAAQHSLILHYKPGPQDSCLSPKHYLPWL